EEKTLLFLPLVIISSVVFFVDYFKIIICSRLIMAVLLCILDKIFREASLCMEDFILISASVAISLLCYFVLLSLQTDTGRMSRELHRKSSTDLLTGLLNKISVEETVRNYLENSEKGAACSLLIFDFDNFKHINDTYGHQTGDDVLKFFGYTLKRSFRDSDILGRIGGDEFMVCVTTPVSDEFFKKRCDSILYELRSAKVGDAGGFSSSIGIAQDMNGTADFELLYSTADQALYQAKQNGKGCFVKKEVPQKN
ncbi:MAG: GGDEF domain-containing protein, partial [Lachnospiraceae bacterium]|nr:GGDEF domain-containing protein [Lachnospiraceae bacterium]